MNRVIWEASYNFNERQLRGADFNVLPFLRMFPPLFGKRHYYQRRRLTVHFGWLWWTVIVHVFGELSGTPKGTPHAS